MLFWFLLFELYYRGYFVLIFLICYFKWSALEYNQIFFCVKFSLKLGVWFTDTKEVHSLATSVLFVTLNFYGCSLEHSKAFVVTTFKEEEGSLISQIEFMLLSIGHSLVCDTSRHCSGILNRTWGAKWRCIIAFPAVSSTMHHTFAFYLMYTFVHILVVQLHYKIWKHMKNSQFVWKLVKVNMKIGTNVAFIKSEQLNHFTNLSIFNASSFSSSSAPSPTHGFKAF